MVTDLIQIARNAKDMEKAVLDIYVPKNGIYFKIMKDGNLEHLVFNRKEMPNSQLADWFKMADYYSCLIDINKPIDSSKKIHSNNYLSFFIKAELLPGMEINSDNELSVEVLQETMNKYYEAFYKEKVDKKTELITNKMDIAELKVEELEIKKKIILEKIDEIIEIAKDKKTDKEIDKKDYVKVFFEEEKETYQQEYIRYTLPRIFNKNEYNVEINGEVFGLSNNNMGTNSKKPYLELKHTHFTAPYRITLEDALLSKKLFDWFNSLVSEEGYNQRELYIPIDFNFTNTQLDESNLADNTCYYLYKEMNNGKTQIQDFDILNFKKKIPVIQMENYLRIADFSERDIASIPEIEKRVDQYFYSNQLQRHYYNDDIKTKTGVFSSRQVNILLQTKGAMLNYFRKGHIEGFKYCFDRMSAEMILQKLIDKEYINPKEIAYALNFRINLLRYYQIGGKENMGTQIIQIQDKIKQKISSDELATCETKEEFYYAAGQLIYYLVSKNQGKNKNYDLAMPFLQISNAKKLKESIKILFKKYSHAISMYDLRTKNLIGMVMGYEEDSKVRDYEDLLIAGLCAKNLLYTKKEEVKEDEE